MVAGILHLLVTDDNYMFTYLDKYYSMCYTVYKDYGGDI